MTPKICIFTIVSNNYLHYANTLFESLTEFYPQTDLVLALCDEVTPDTHCPAADIIAIKELKIPDLGTFAYQYTILELNTAIKPYVIEQLMDRGYEKIIYFDPDICVFGSLDPMLALLDSHNVLLTPHLNDLLDDGKLPDELAILQAGSYNLGYIALRTCEETRKLVGWWQRKLYKECVVDVPRNLFVDQKWMDLVPAMFDGVYINRNPTWNIAYWNLNHRTLSQQSDGSFNVNGRPLIFFHFSGFSIEGSSLSKHQNRFDKGPPGTPLRELCTRYGEALFRNGSERFKHLPYAFSRFADGTPVPDCARRLIRTRNAFDRIDFFDRNQCVHIHEELNRLNLPRKGGIALTALSLALWESRSDLREGFPAVEGIDSVRYAEWLLDAAQREAGFSEVYLRPVREALDAFRARSTGPSSSMTERLTSKLFRFAWQHRQLIPLRMRLALGPYVGWALNRAYPRSDLPLPSTVRRTKELGVNLIGYLHAESGIGEAARASLRALRCSQLPHAVVDYRLGNLSRMDERIGEVNTNAIYPINLMHVNADQSKIARDHLGWKFFRDRYTIGYWYWEMPRFPESLHFAYKQVDEIWVSTEYARKAIAEFTDKPVTVIPPAIEVRIEKALTRTQLHLDENAFIFLHMSDALSMPQRKNPSGAIRAFLHAFGDRPDLNVNLVIKLSNLDKQPSFAQEVYQALELDKRIILIDGYLDRNTLNNLISQCDCYVSLHRSEGFGLPIAEAMYLGKPVIATPWSGNSDFMDVGNSLPIKYKLIELDENVGLYNRGQQWAEPDLNDAASKMQVIYSSETLRYEISANASLTIQGKFAPSSIARLIEHRTAEIKSIIR